MFTIMYIQYDCLEDQTVTDTNPQYILSMWWWWWWWCSMISEQRMRRLNCGTLVVSTLEKQLMYVSVSL